MEYGINKTARKSDIGKYREAYGMMDAAIPSIEQSREKYIVSVYGAAALAYIAIIHTNEAMDLMQWRTPGLIRRKAKMAYRRIYGLDGHVGLIRMLELSINEKWVNKADGAWVADFGNATYERAEPHIIRLQNAIANVLGRYHGVPDINVCAAVVLAQSIAHEQVQYVKRRAELLRNYTVLNHDRQRTTVSSALSSMSCATLDHALRTIAISMLEHNVPLDFDLASDPTVLTGLKSVLNVLADTRTWIFAREKADSLNA